MIKFVLSNSTEKFVRDPEIKELQVFSNELGSEASSPRYLLLEVDEALAVVPVLSSFALGVEFGDSTV